MSQSLVSSAKNSGSGSNIYLGGFEVLFALKTYWASKKALVGQEGILNWAKQIRSTWLVFPLLCASTQTSHHRFVPATNKAETDSADCRKNLILVFKYLSRLLFKFNFVRVQIWNRFEENFADFHVICDSYLFMLLFEKHWISQFFMICLQSKPW